MGTFTKTDRIVIQRRVNTTVSLHFVTRTDQGAHPPTTREGHLERFKPIRVAVRALMVVVTESLECLNNKVVRAAFVPINDENQDV